VTRGWLERPCRQGMPHGCSSTPLVRATRPTPPCDADATWGLTYMKMKC
jgi:hypothetical protein